MKAQISLSAHEMSWPLSILFLFIMGFQQSCKKADINGAAAMQQPSKNAEKVFFQIPSNTTTTVQRIANKITEQNSQYHFVNDFAAREGLPIWNKAMIQPHNRSSLQGYSKTTTQNNQLNEEDTTVLIPLVLENTQYVNAFLACSVGDSINIRLINAGDYEQFGFHNIQDSISADKIALQTMLLEQNVFGHKEYHLLDPRLFNHTENGVTIHPEFCTLGKTDTSIVTPSLMATITTCIQVTVNGGWLAGCPPGANCNNLQTFEICDSWSIWIEESSGGSSGNPCTSCIEWWVPAGGVIGGTGSIGWYHTPELTAEQQADSDWCNYSIKDSTINNCVSQALTGLKNINAKLPRLIRSFFDTAGTPAFKMHFKMENVTLWQGLGTNWSPPEGAHTTYNTTSSSFNVFVNAYYADATDLAHAATIIHEALHCQLMNWFREAYALNDTVRRNQLAFNYGYIFTDEINHQDSSVRYIVQGLDPTQHQDIATRYLDTVALALYQFALSKNIPANLSYCRDIAWIGCLGSKAFHSLSVSTQERIIDRIAAEKDPLSNLLSPLGVQYNTNNSNPKGHPCHNTLEL